MRTTERIPASFRDPSGFLFVRDGAVHRQINESYRHHYDRLVGSGLYEHLVRAELLIAHEETPRVAPPADGAYKVIRPEQLDFVSYPYEWCFSQLKDSAMTTLRVQRAALDFGMTLKDASAYNVQLHRGQPVFIDTLSFEEYREGEPWVAYRQFCQHFLGPLALMSRVDVRLSQLLRVFIEGVPLELCSKLLPLHSWLSPALMTHLHLHAAAERRARPSRSATQRHVVSRTGMLGILASLEAGVRRLRWKPGDTIWSNYYSETNYSSLAQSQKQALVRGFLGKLAPRSVWDLGANTGVFSRIAASDGALVVSFDLDAATVETNYRACRANQDTRVLPLVLDLANPSAGIGWANRERSSIFDRGRPDVVLALALVHHLAISNNVPLVELAEFFWSLGGSLIIEFVPKSDSQVQRMLVTREDVFPDYTQAVFEREFGERFDISHSTPINGTESTLYLMRIRH